jgi:hypothetical protein
MKNNEPKNRISSIYPSPRPGTPSAEDLQKQELEHEMRIVEKELYEEFTLEQNTFINGPCTFQTETKKLKLMLNKLTCSNKVKTAKIEKLKDLVFLSRKELSNPETVSKLKESNERFQELKSKLDSLEAENKKQLGENEMLVEMKDKESKEIIAFKERLNRELKAVQKIQDLNEQKKVFSYLIKLQNSSAQQTLQESRRLLQKTQENFNEDYSALQKTKLEQEKEVRKHIEKISKSNIKSRETKTAISRMQMSLEEHSILTTDNNIQIRKSKSKLSEIRDLLSLLRMHCQDCPKFSEPLKKQDIDFIISSYSKLHFQEHSLSLKFGNLTEEQIDKQRKCDAMIEELKKIKEDEEIDSSYKKSRLTFNELKSLLDDQKILGTKQVLEQSQKMILKVYLKVLSISNFFVKSLSTIACNSKFHVQDNAILLFLEDVKSLQRSPKNNQTTGFLIKRKQTKALEKKKTYKTDLEPNEEYQPSRLNLQKIKEFLKKIIERKNEKARFGGDRFGSDLIDLNQCSLMISNDLLACFFIDVHDLDSKNLERIDTSQELVKELNKIGIQVFSRKFSVLLTALSEISNWVQRKTKLLQSEIIDFYQETSSDTEIFEKGLNKNSFKALVKYLFENSEKFESRQKKRASEESCSHVFSANSVADDQSVKSRIELPTADKTVRTHQSFNFNLASVHSASDSRAFEGRIKSYSTRNLIHEARRIRLSPSNYYGDPLRSAMKKKISK